MDLGFVSGAGVVGGRVTSGSVCRDAKRGVVTMSASRRDVLKIALGAAAALVFPVGSALADGSVSYGTRVRARGLYGSKIMQLETSVTEIPALVEGQQWVQLLRLISSSDKKPGTIYTNLNAFQLYKTGYFADSRPVRPQTHTRSTATTFLRRIPRRKRRSSPFLSRTWFCLFSLQISPLTETKNVDATPN